MREGPRDSCNVRNHQEHRDSGCVCTFDKVEDSASLSMLRCVAEAMTGCSGIAYLKGSAIVGHLVR